MPGMDWAKATVVGVYNTTVYTVLYTLTTGGEKVIDHKWVIHEEIKEAGSDPCQVGDTVTLNADVMEGIARYNYRWIVKNHQWVIKCELDKKLILRRGLI